MLRRWGASALIYTVGEIAGAALQQTPPDPHRVGRVAAVGAVGDAVCLRAFHAVVDRRLPNPVLRVACEQLCYAPFSTAGYLTVAGGRVERTQRSLGVSAGPGGAARKNA